MDVHGKHLTEAALQHEGQHLLPSVPQAAGDPVRLCGVEALVVQQRMAVRAARRVLHRASLSDSSMKPSDVN